MKSGGTLYLISDPAHGVVDEFGAIFETEFFFDMGAVGVGGFEADGEFFGDAAIVFALSGEAEDFEFAGGEFGEEGGEGSGAGAGEGLEDGGGGAGAGVDLAAEDGGDGGEDFFGILLFHDVAAATGAEDAFGVEGFVVHRDDEDGGEGGVGDEFLEEFEAAFAGEADVHEDEVWGEAEDFVEGLGSAVGFDADDEDGDLAQNAAEAFEEDGVVIDEEDGFGGGERWGARMLGGHGAVWGGVWAGVGGSRRGWCRGRRGYFGY